MPGTPSRRARATDRTSSPQAATARAASTYGCGARDVRACGLSGVSARVAIGPVGRDVPARPYSCERPGDIPRAPPPRIAGRGRSR